MTDQVRVEYISDREIEKQAVAVLKEFGIYDKVPVPIEYIVDNKLLLNVIPFPNLLKTFDVNSCIRGDLSGIYVDEHLYTNLNLQYRFALAHELGHLMLHDHIYKDHPYSTIASYKQFIMDFNETAYAAFEAQAHKFASYFLVPGHHLEPYFERNCKGIDGFIKATKDKAMKIEVITSVVGRRLSPIFQVHERPIKIRIERSNLVQKYFAL